MCTSLRLINQANLMPLVYKYRVYAILHHCVITMLAMYYGVFLPRSDVIVLVNNCIFGAKNLTDALISLYYYSIDAMHDSVRVKEKKNKGNWSDWLTSVQSDCYRCLDYSPLTSAIVSPNTVTDIRRRILSWEFFKPETLASLRFCSLIMVLKYMIRGHYT